MKMARTARANNHGLMPKAKLKVPSSNALKIVGSVYSITTEQYSQTPDFLTAHDSILQPNRDIRRGYLLLSLRKVFD